MIQTSWWSQRFAPEGSVAAEGIVKQLGRPEMDPLTVLVREAAQNSWDARCGNGPVDFRISLYRLAGTAAKWRQTILPPPAPESRNGLDEVLNADCIMLVVSDRNTVGLGGPIRAGTRPDHGERADFVQFIRNVGEPRDQKFGGGTYGFGKGIFYQLSRVGAILVDTRTAQATPSRRLMGAALGESYYVGDQRYTGRHWWGADGDVADPLLDSDAEATSHTLGLPGFRADESGTDIVIIAADLGLTGGEPDSPPRTLEQAAEYLGSSMLWHLWPKFVANEDDRYMRFVVSVNGRDIELPSPESLDEFKPFVESLREVRAQGGAAYARTVAPRVAGYFSLRQTTAKAPAGPLVVDAARPFEGPPHHVARMRAPELVVDYFPTDTHSDARLAYGAVFKASPEADEAFALSEPPTHDAWISRGLAGTDRGVVQGLAKFLNREVRSIVSPHTTAAGDHANGLGELSSRLGTLIPTFEVWSDEHAVSSGEARSPGNPINGKQSGVKSGSETGSGRRKPLRKPRIVGIPRVEVHGEVPLFVATVDLPPSDGQRRVRAGIDIVIEGGKVEAEPPEGADMPKIIEWRSVSTAESTSGPVLTVEPDGQTEWKVYASYVADAVVRFRLNELTSDGGRHAQ
ncbi:hypothetical protein V4U86_19075 [Mycobacterium sp. AMU20-3851]|uniref:hypothetical protein n=1 Tax=Mycobacterium sp. AMU20-3851 TaxID=3122055 RepID=UPI003755056A